MQLPSEPEATVSVAVKPSFFRCACGSDVQLFNLRGTCQECGRAVSLASLDASQTISFVSMGTSGSSSSEADALLQQGCDRSGERLGHFRLVSMLGQGGMGVVYRALDESLQRYVAVKVMRCTTAEGSSAVRVTRLLDEAVAQARLNHPHVVTIFYVGRDSNDPFFAMELLPGPTLDKLLLDGPLPYSDVIKYARQVTSALDQATRLNLVHGDIKPSNLIIACGDSVKLGDFGLAQTDQKSNTGISGTLSYMAPELAEGVAPSAQSDMYALGITLFELTFGRRPYAISGQSLSEQLASHRSAAIEFPEKWPVGIPERWRYVLERLLAKQPGQRYPDYPSLDADLRAIAPVGVTKAGRLNRGFALALDYIVQFLLMVPLVIFFMVAEMSQNSDSILKYLYEHGLGLLSVFCFVIPAAMTWVEWHGWTTPGRYFFQLRVVDEHGLRLTRRKRLLRSLMRNAPVWAFALAVVSNTLHLNLLQAMTGWLDEILLVVDAIPILGPARRTLHDRLIGSTVVLDTTK